MNYFYSHRLVSPIYEDYVLHGMATAKFYCKNWKNLIKLIYDNGNKTVIRL